MGGRLIILVYILLGVTAGVFLLFDGGAAALALVMATTAIALWIFTRFADDKQTIVSIFLGGLLVRLLFGLLVHAFDLRLFFGGDAITYDFLGNEMLLRWFDSVTVPNPTVEWQLNNIGGGWGMFYLVAGIYSLLGRNILAAQSFCAVVGAAIAPMLYFCAFAIYQNKRVARTAAILVAFFPAFVIWSGQLLKDGLIVFLLVLAMTMILQLQKKFSYGALLLLFAAIAGVLPLRFYIFYMLAMAVLGSFVIGFSTSAQAIARNTVILVILGLGLTYVGVMRNASTAFETYGNLAQLQNSRSDLAQSAGSGFNSDVDVSTTEGAISAIPIGLTYLMLAPFPWQISSFRAAITVPEILVWWAMIPLMVYGMFWTLKHRLRAAFPILLFSVMLSLAYSIFQGNVGTAYRQRTQIQVFLFVFVAVTLTLRQEKAENKELIREERQRRLAAQRRRDLSTVGS